MIELSIRFTANDQEENSPIHVSLFRPDRDVAINSNAGQVCKPDRYEQRHD